jgi:hypothetical protein
LSREELAPLDELRTATKATNEREKIRSDVARYWKSIGKWEFTDAEMNAEIDRRIERKTSMKGVA